MTDWNPQANEIFLAVVEQTTNADRQKLLDSLCGTDVELRSQVESLLAANDNLGSFLEHPAVDCDHTVTYPEPGGSGSSPGSDTLREAADISLGFLQPSEQSGSLGRLGQYEIIETVGRGGMGIVLKAHDTKLNRVVAVKVLAPELAANSTARRRFLREAQAAAAVSHDHVVTIHAVEENEQSGKGQLPYLVMEFIDGQSLQQKLERQGPLELKEVLRIGRQVAAGLAAAHSQGLIHRDVKPSNILLQNGIERVQITDFGLARAVDDVAITQTGEITGTPQYMSPEQAQGQSVDTRSDLFSLGSVMYAMCTGRSPFRAETTMTALRRVCDETPRPIREINPDIPEWLTAIIERLLEKDPADRFQTASEVAELLSRHLAHLQDPGLSPFPGTTQPVSSRVAAVAGRYKRWLVAGLILVAIAATFSVTEATGVTELSATVLRIVTGEGTLIVEVDDPSLSVTVDHDGEELTVRDGTHHIFTLRPGKHQVRVSKNGDPVRTELVTITRGGRKVVTVSREMPADRRAGIGDKQTSRAVAGSDSNVLTSEHWTWTTPENLGNGVNSEYAEGGPFLSDDGLSLVFVSVRPGGLGEMDLWMSTRSALDEDWSAAVNLGPNINTAQADHGATLSTDGLTLLFASDRPDGHGHWDLWMSKRKSIGADWSVAVNLGPVVNSQWAEGSPSLSSDGLTLVFHSNRPGGLGGADFWLTSRKSLTAEWAEPVHLGPVVNSEHEERGPRLAAGGRTLFYSSNRPGGEGSFDLWMSRGASPYGPWSEPVNLGSPINGAGYDFYASYSSSAQILVFESGGRSGNLGGHDLWMTRRVPKVDHGQAAEEAAAQGEYDEAARHFHLALSRLEPDAPYPKLAAIYQRLAQWDDVFDRVAELRPRDGNLWRERGHVMAGKGNWDEAVRSYQRRSELGPDGGGFWRAYALALLGKNDNPAYRKLCKEIITKFSGHPSPGEQLHVVAAAVIAPIDAADSERALQMAEHCYSELPDRIDAAESYAAWLYRAGKYEQSIRTFEECAQLANRGLYFYPEEFRRCFLAMAQHRLGNTEQARQWSKQVHAAELPAGHRWHFPVISRHLVAEMDEVLKTPPGGRAKSNDSETTKPETDEDQNKQRAAAED